MRDKLAKLIEREADALLALPAGLVPEQIETLEALCKCARALGGAEDVPEPEAEDAPVEDDLAKVDTLR